MRLGCALVSSPLLHLNGACGVQRSKRERDRKQRQVAALRRDLWAAERDLQRVQTFDDNVERQIREAEEKRNKMLQDREEEKHDSTPVADAGSPPKLFFDPMQEEPVSSASYSAFFGVYLFSVWHDCLPSTFPYLSSRPPPRQPTPLYLVPCTLFVLTPLSHQPRRKVTSCDRLPTCVGIPSVARHPEMPLWGGFGRVEGGA